MSSDDDNLNRHLKRAMLQIEAKIDQELGPFRDEYMGLTGEHRTVFRKRVEELAAMEFLPPAIPTHARILIQVHIPQGDGPGITATASPTLVLKAIRLWDNDEMFRPDGWRDCVPDR